MHEMRQRRTKPPQQERDTDRHAQLLDPPGQQNRLDARRNELRMAGDRREAQTLADGGQRPEELPYLRLVTPAAPAEQRPGDYDERVAQYRAYRYGSSPCRGESCH